MTLRHQDVMDAWKDRFRIHVPIITHPGAYLVAGGRSMHFKAGHAWSFDNQSDHGVVNDGPERVHLIFDVDLTDVLKAQLDKAIHHRGTRIQAHLEKIGRKELASSSYPGDVAMLNGISSLRSKGHSYAKIAELCNAKGISTKRWAAAGWDEEMVKELEQSLRGNAGA